jgi:hypothetical protein
MFVLTLPDSAFQYMSRQLTSGPVVLLFLTCAVNEATCAAWALWVLIVMAEDILKLPTCQRYHNLFSHTWFPSGLVLTLTGANGTQIRKSKKHALLVTILCINVQKIGKKGCDNLSRGLLGCDTMKCCGRIPVFQRSVLLPPSGWSAEDGGSIDLWNSDNLPQHYMESQPRRQLGTTTMKASKHVWQSNMDSVTPSAVEGTNIALPNWQK